MWNKYYVKRTTEKEAIHDNDLELFAIQKARELGWDSSKVNHLLRDSKENIGFHQEDATNLLQGYLQRATLVV